MELRVHITTNRPYFAELPYYLWDDPNYNSEGDCRRPTDQRWKNLSVSNRDTGEWVDITGQYIDYTIKSDDEQLVYRTALFLQERCDAVFYPVELPLTAWDHEAAMKRTLAIRADFENPKLKPFDDHVFWGSWKWTGKSGSDFTWVGRWIMYSLVNNDTRGVALCADWLRGGTYNETQSKALRYALEQLTGKTFATDKAWSVWYYGPDEEGVGEGQFLYPMPDIKAWYAEK